MEGVGWLSVPWGAGGEEKKIIIRGRSSTRPTHPVQSCPVKELRAGGVDVDYNGGASCRRADVRVCGGGKGRKGNSVGSRFQFCS